jgi:tetratricopeptide (TPR) repeat protein
LKEVKSPSEAYQPRATAEEVYAQVIADFTDAINLLPAPTFAAAQTGRVTKGMAAAELGVVYLQRKEYAKAIPLFQSVTQMGYSLLPNFRDVFNPANKNANREMIFDVQFQSGTTGQQSNFPYRFTPITNNTTNILGVAFNNTIGGWMVPTDDLISTFEAGDTRFDASIGIIEGTVDANNNFLPTKVVSAVNYTAPAGVTAKRFARKYFYPPYPNLNQNTDQNWPLYRYSDVLLMLAECLNEVGRSAEALEPLNLVRTRAFGVGKGQITNANQAALRTIIAKERRTELAFENKRWQDLIRTGQAVAVLSAYGAKVKQQFPYLLPQTYNVTPEKLLYPIPLREIQLNPKLTQNPGY